MPLHIMEAKNEILFNFRKISYHHTIICATVSLTKHKNVTIQWKTAVLISPQK